MVFPEYGTKVVLRQRIHFLAFCTRIDAFGTLKRGSERPRKGESPDLGTVVHPVPVL